MLEQQPADNRTSNPTSEFSIQRIYLKGLSFESPQSPQIFVQEWEPHLEMALGTQTHPLADGFHHVVLTVTVTVKVKDQTVFLVEAQQAGIFAIQHFPEEQLRSLLGSDCPSILYPYVREVITDVVMKGGFPQLYLAPVNFDAFYRQHQESAIAH